MATRKIFKWSLIALGAVVLLATALIIAASLFMDPNDYKEPIQRAVLERTGRQLHLEGDLSLSVFPWIGLEIEDAWLENPQGFAEGPFARIDRAALRVKLLPLLKKRVQVATIVLDGLHVRLIRRPDGRSNWEDLTEARPASAKEPAPKAPEPTPSPASLPLISVSGLRVNNARLEWNDALAKQSVTVSRISLSTDSIEPGTFFPVELSLQWESTQPHVLATLNLEAQAMVDPSADRWAVRPARLDLSLEKADFVQEPAKLSLEIEGGGSLTGAALKIPSMKLHLPGLAANAQLTITQNAGIPRLEGKLQAQPVEPRRLLQILYPQGLAQLPEKVLRQASLELRFLATPHSLKIPELQASLDEAQLSGRVDLSSLQPVKGSFQWHLNRLDLDQILAATAGSPTAPKASGQSAPGSPGPQPPPSSSKTPLRIPPGTDLSGMVDMEQLRAAKLSISSVKAKILVRNDHLTVEPFQAGLYGGKVTGSFGLSADPKRPSGALAYQLQGVDLGALLQDLQGKESLTGTASVKGKTTFAGLDGPSIIRSLTGTTSIRVTDGSYKGINIPRMIRRAKAALQGRTLAPGEEEDATDFTELTATLVMKNGVVANDDLSAKSPYLRVGGQGRLDLPAEKIDYLLTTTLVAVPRGQSGEDLKDLLGIPIPIRIQGPLAKPRYALDMQAVIQSAAKGKVREKAKALEGTLKEKLQKKAPPIKGFDLKKLF
ncbi:AsmA protein [Desulfacinum hydrothermale DSM 13146]|uniref:AsmA protein n=1 Tax=Desulfacinum hydrothermale DSM 13146 TaxID=1121390 RepID=A0A1W1XK32_9BACT|nr:AsmA family protein [Desulfacinum hydrothermale]SMC23911.1 AsmA protein [Desulfacinum hydrothermale DSM 13146]